MEIGRALEESAKEMGWSVTRLSAEAGVTEKTGRSWYSGTTIVASDKLLLLVGKMPGLKARLFPPERVAS